MPTSVDNDPPRPHTMKSQQNFHTREETDQLVEEIYRALETTEERLNGRCDGIYFPMKLYKGNWWRFRVTLPVDQKHGYRSTDGTRYRPTFTIEHRSTTLQTEAG
ncbi:hypothetical protein F2Q69_00042341 [Brassica cretica]|uniref:Uncharacterized protein n=1 Tax=Brassica cretica TaxID=69181 RepID=A0A8S9NEA5_BRACR|nr:hypothetical protein F2Q69_00042341 [Brassica cretica]